MNRGTMASEPTSECAVHWLSVEYSKRQDRHPLTVMKSPLLAARAAVIEQVFIRRRTFNGKVAEDDVVYAPFFGSASFGSVPARFQLVETVLKIQPADPFHGFLSRIEDVLHAIVSTRGIRLAPSQTQNDSASTEFSGEIPSKPPMA